MKKTTVLENTLKQQLTNAKLVNIEIEANTWKDEPPKYESITFSFHNGESITIGSTLYDYDLDCITIDGEYMGEFDKPSKLELRKEEIKRKQRELEREKEQLQKELDELE